ncbi:MAG: carbohydrate porin [Thiohalomonadaceae bacterium]
MKYASSLLVLAATAAVPAFAQEGETNGAVVEGGLVATFQHAADDRVSDEATASVDLAILLPASPGALNVHVEGSSSVGGDVVSALIPDANADVGTALDRDGDGRFQVSELYYGIELGGTTVYAGLLDATGFLDGSDIANDEAAQFINATLVNNPTIEFPDYSIGLALQTAPQDGLPGLTLLAAGSHGLGDNPNRSYRQLLDMDADGKGVFVAAEVFWELGDITPRFGLWTQTADHDRFDGASATADNRGAYGVIDGAAGSLRWNLRAGVADERVSAAAWFAGAALERPVGPAVLGLGVTHTGVSGDAQDAAPDALDDTTQVELHARFDLGAQLQITPSIQYVRNPGFDSTGDAVDEETWVTGVRVTAAF